MTLDVPIIQRHPTPVLQRFLIAIPTSPIADNVTSIARRNYSNLASSAVIFFDFPSMQQVSDVNKHIILKPSAS